MPPALLDFLQDELFATAAFGYDLGPAVEYMATAHLRTGLEEDMTNDVSSLAPVLWRVGKAAKPVLPLWVSEADRKAYEKAPTARLMKRLGRRRRPKNGRNFAIPRIPWDSRFGWK